MSQAEKHHQQAVAASHVILRDFQARERKALLALLVAALLLVLCFLAGG